MPNPATPSTPMNSRQVLFLLAGLFLTVLLSVSPVAATIVSSMLFGFIPHSLAMFGIPAQSGTAPEVVIGLTAILLTLAIEVLVLFPIWAIARRHENGKWFAAICLALLTASLFIALWGLAGLVLPGQAGWTALIRMVVTLPWLVFLLRRLRIPAPAIPSHVSIPTLLFGLGAGAILLIPWMSLGALGTRVQTLESLAQAMAVGAGEEILLRGLIFAIIFRATGRPNIAFLVAFVAGFSMQPGYILPLGNWLMILRMVNMLITGLLFTELAARGSIGSAIVVHAAFEFGYPAFVDPRMEFSLPHPAALMSLGFAMLLYLCLMMLRVIPARLEFFSSRNLRLSASALFGSVAILSAFGAWFLWGNPGWSEDGFLIILREQADLSKAAAISDRTERIAFVYETLVDTAERTQTPLLAKLAQMGVSYRRHYLINAIEVEDHTDLMTSFQNRPDVQAVIRNPNVRKIRYVETMDLLAGSSSGKGVEWNIELVQAPAVWEQGYTGQGIVVAGADTGVDWTHPALRKSYRGILVDSGMHAYNWFDPWDNSREPFDDIGHGTHTLGTVVGDDGSGNQIGVAPGATWMACRNMRSGLGNPGKYLSCMEFFLAPFPTGGDPLHDGRPAEAPHIVNNSWGCMEFEGCTPNTLQLAVENLRIAGIMMVVSAGNEGPACSTITAPPSGFDSVFTVGAVNRYNILAFFSSRGPSEGRVKPDVSAPGVGIRSSLPGGKYGSASGTSAASPHVAGLAALLWSADSVLRSTGDILNTERIIRDSATPQYLQSICEISDGSAAKCLCGSDTQTDSPNNAYGHGIIDAWAALVALLGGS